MTAFVIVANRYLVVLAEMQYFVAADVERLHNAVSSKIDQIAIRRCERGVPYTRLVTKNRSMCQLLKIDWSW